MHHDHSKKRTEGFRRERTHQNKISNGNKISNFRDFLLGAPTATTYTPRGTPEAGHATLAMPRNPGGHYRHHKRCGRIKSRLHVELNLEITPGIRDFISFEFPPCRWAGRPALPCFLSRAFAAPIHSVDLVDKLSGGSALPLAATSPELNLEHHKNRDFFCVIFVPSTIKSYQRCLIQLH